MNDYAQEEQHFGRKNVSPCFIKLRRSGILLSKEPDDERIATCLPAGRRNERCHDKLKLVSEK